MTLDRKQRLTLIRQSRAATQRLAALVRKDDCSLEGVEALLDLGAIVEEATTEIPDKRMPQHKKTRQAIEFVLERDQHEVVRALWLAGGLNHPHGHDWLDQAVHAGANQSLKALVEAGAAQQLPENEQARVIRSAAATGNAQALGWLLEAGLDPSRQVRDNYGMGEGFETALHRAANAQCVRRLLDFGANLNAPDNRGFPPLHMILSMAAMKSRERSAARMDEYHAQARAYLEAATELVTSGCELEATIDNGYRWGVIDQLNEIQIDCSNLLDVLKDRIDPQMIARRVKSPQLALSLLETIPGIDPSNLMNSYAWAHLHIERPEVVVAVESLLLRGVPLPTIQEVDERYVANWLAFGIPVSAEDAQWLFNQIDENGEQLHDDVDEVSIAESNKKALERVAQHANAPSMAAGRPRM